MKKILIYLFASLIIVGETTAQCFPDRHNTTWFDGWISCDEAENPNPERGPSHWIMYDLAHQYELGQVHIWNSNNPKNLDWGIREMIVDYSTDGTTWKELGTYTIEMAPGITTYEGVNGPDFGGVEVRYLLLTAKNNWGGVCTGFSEIRIQVHGVNAVNDQHMAKTFDAVVYPNPFKTSFKVEITTKQNEAVAYSLIDVYGRELRKGTIVQPQNVNYITIGGTGLSAGIYYLKISQGQDTRHFGVVKTN